MTQEKPETTYDYDVAFSFVKDDEDLVTQLNDALQGRYETFLYAKRQEELAGNDGEKVFNEVFGQRARTVIVIYRDTWGETPWTRIEETAIRNRAYNEGYDFALFIPVTEPPSVPKWLPKTRIWHNYGRFGIEATVAVIDSHVQQHGGKARPESVADRTARLERALQNQQRREQFLHSVQGVELSTEAYGGVLDHVEKWAVSDHAKKAGVHCKRRDQALVLLHSGGRQGDVTSLSFARRRTYANDIKDDYVEVSTWDGHPPFTGVMLFDEPQKKATWRFLFDLSGSGEVVFVEEGAERRIFSADRFADEIVRRYTDAIHTTQVQRR